MTRCDPDAVHESRNGTGRLTCLDCGRGFLVTAEWEAHLEVEHPDSPRRPYDVPLWES